MAEPWNSPGVSGGAAGPEKRPRKLERALTAPRAAFQMGTGEVLDACFVYGLGCRHLDREQFPAQGSATGCGGLGDRSSGCRKPPPPTGFFLPQLRQVGRYGSC